MNEQVWSKGAGLQGVSCRPQQAHDACRTACAMATNTHIHIHTHMHTHSLRGPAHMRTPGGLTPTMLAGKILRRPGAGVGWNSMKAGMARRPPHDSSPGVPSAM